MQTKIRAEQTDTDSATQTLTNKTIDGDNNTILIADPTTDTNSWKVYNYGSFKVYSRRWTDISPGAIGANAIYKLVDSFSLPVGKSPSTSLILVSGSTSSGSTAFIYTVGYDADSTATDGTYNVYMRNVAGASITPLDVSVTIFIIDA